MVSVYFKPVPLSSGSFLPAVEGHDVSASCGLFRSLKQGSTILYLAFSRQSGRKLPPLSPETRLADGEEEGEGSIKQIPFILPATVLSFPGRWSSLLSIQQQQPWGPRADQTQPALFASLFCSRCNVPGAVLPFHTQLRRGGGCVSALCV